MLQVSTLEAAAEILSKDPEILVGMVYLSTWKQDTIEEFVSDYGRIDWIALIKRGDLEYASVRRAIVGSFFDYHTLPVDINRLVTLLGRAHGMANLRSSTLEHKLSAGDGLCHDMVGTSDAIRRIKAVIDKVAMTNFPVFIYGESGTGKELVARAIHRRSERSNKSLVTVNCGAIVPGLIQSELFGHEKGSFTSADKQKDGYFSAAHGGTIFLDEVGELPLETQASLLRILEENTYRRVGGTQNIPGDVRLITATNRDLRSSIKNNKFREDLFYRLSVIEIEVPSLAQRPEDIEVLAEYYLDRIRKEVNGKAEKFSRKSVEAMLVYSWPGNIRELINRIKRAVLLCENRIIGPSDLGLESSLAYREDGTALSALSLKKAKESAERETLVRAAAYANSNVTLTAQLLGVSRVTVYQLLKKHGLC